MTHVLAFFVTFVLLLLLIALTDKGIEVRINNDTYLIQVHEGK